MILFVFSYGLTAHIYEKEGLSGKMDIYRRNRGIIHKTMKSKLIAGDYTLVSVNYIPMVDGCGTLCENCGRPISNIATVKHEQGNTYTIGLDCAKTLLSKEVYRQAGIDIKRKKKISDKIRELEKYGKPYVLNEFGKPCYPPETRSGYMIQY